MDSINYINNKINKITLLEKKYPDQGQELGMLNILKTILLDVKEKVQQEQCECASYRNDLECKLAEAEFEISHMDGNWGER